MKTTTPTLACFLVALAPIVHAASTNLPPRLTVELRDGSRVIGTSVTKELAFHSTLLGKVNLKVQDIRAVDWPSTNSAKVTTVNGDLLLVSPDDAAFAIQTGFGRVELAAQTVRSIYVSCPGGVRHALKFNLKNRVEIPNDPQLQFGSGPFTVACWLKTETDRPYISLLSKRTNPMGDGWVLHQDHGQLLFYCAGCCSPKSRPVSIRDGQWHQVLVTRAGGIMTFCLDGQIVGSGRDDCNHFDNNPLRIGMDGDGDAWHFDGELSEVHLYDRALNRDEIAEEWNNGLGINHAVTGGSLVAGYHFDEAQGPVAKDFSGNHHDGTLFNEPEWSN
jgi:hypothetical protein